MSKHCPRCQLSYNRGEAYGKKIGIQLGRLDAIKAEQERILKEFIKYVNDIKSSMDNVKLDKRKQKDCDISFGLVLKNMALLQSIDVLKDVIIGKQFDEVEYYWVLSDE